MLSTTSGSELVASSNMRRSRTLGSKVPRKRTALLVQSKRATAQALAVLGAGGDGPTGGSGNGGGSGRPYELCCGGNGGDGEAGRAGFSWRVSAQGAAVALLGLGLLGASPAWAATTITTDPNITAASPVPVDSAAASAAVPCLTASEDEDASLVVFRTLPDNYTPNALAEEEKELVCPKQFRVREWVFVH